MKLSLISLILAFACTCTFAAKNVATDNGEQKETKPILAGYYPDWGKWEKPAYPSSKVPYSKFTHVIWSFISPNADGSLRGDAADDPSELDEMVKLAHASDTKVILSLGGAGLCENFATVAKNESLRTKFISNLIEYVAIHNLDGLDMDWEFTSVPVPETDTIAYNKLLRDLRAALPADKSLSAALPCSPYYGKYFTASVLVETLDWLGFMTYDITGDWDDKARYNSPLHPNGDYTTWSWEETADYWGKLGVPANKMVFGIPFFGFKFEDANKPASAFTPGKTKNIDYKEVVKMTGLQFEYDSISNVPYAYSENIYITYENQEAVAAKAQWVLDSKYAGTMIWEITQDVLDDYSQPLLDTLGSILWSSSPKNPQGITHKKSTNTNTGNNKATKYNYDALGHESKYTNAKKVYFRK